MYPKQITYILFFSETWKCDFWSSFPQIIFIVKLYCWVKYWVGLSFNGGYGIKNLANWMLRKLEFESVQLLAFVGE